MAVITESGVERLFIPGNELPKFWEGKEILPAQVIGSHKLVDAPLGAVPIEIET
jgi:20S proteasome subunit beta 1